MDSAETFRDVKQSDAYVTIVDRLEAALKGTSRRIAAKVTQFANAALVFALNFVLPVVNLRVRSASGRISDASCPSASSMLKCEVPDLVDVFNGRDLRKLIPKRK